MTVRFFSFSLQEKEIDSSEWHRVAVRCVIRFLSQEPAGIIGCLGTLSFNFSNYSVVTLFWNPVWSCLCNAEADTAWAVFFLLPRLQKSQPEWRDRFWRLKLPRLFPSQLSCRDGFVFFPIASNICNPAGTVVRGWVSLKKTKGIIFLSFLQCSWEENGEKSSYRARLGLAEVGAVLSLSWCPLTGRLKHRRDVCI